MTAQHATSVKIVGVCASGKSTLGRTLDAAGYAVYACAQEHSYVPDLWRRRNPADVLIFLDAQADTIAQRRHTAEPVEAWVAEQRNRLAHARQHCDLYLPTDELTPGEVAAIVLDFLTTRPTPAGTEASSPQTTRLPSSPTPNPQSPSPA